MAPFLGGDTGRMGRLLPHIHLLKKAECEWLTGPGTEVTGGGANPNAKREGGFP